MIDSGLCIAAALALVCLDGTTPPPPHSVDPRLVLEQVAKEPEIVTPTGLAVDPRGRVLVIESHTHFRPKGYRGPIADRIRVFEDTNGDGRLDATGTFFEGTKLTMSLAFARDGRLFVATRSAIYRMEDRDGDGRADGEAAKSVPAPLVRLDTPGDYPHNGLSGFAFDLAGNVYFGLGENLGASYRLIGGDGTVLAGGGEGGNVYRCKPDGSKLERISTGFWNPFHLAFDAFGRLFAIDNDPDSRPPCRLLHIVEGGDYGYRFRNGRKGLHPFTAWNGELPGTLPMVAGTGEAPSGVIVYESDNLPEEYRGSLLVTSWGDHRIERYRLQPRGASFRASMEPVVVGGEDFRPVGIAVAPDGSIYFSDWVDKSYELHGKGRIWRLRNAATLPRVVSPKPEENLAHHDRRVREQAASELVSRGAKGLAALDKAVASSPDPRASTLAFETLKVKTHPKSMVAMKGVWNPFAEVREVAARLGLDEKHDPDHDLATDPSPLVRAEALRHLVDPAGMRLLLNALESDDPFVQQAGRQGLSRLLSIPQLVELADDTNPAHRLGILLILRDSGSPDTRGRMKRFLADPDPAIHFAAIQWVGEQRLVEYRPQLLEGLSSAKVSRQVFEGTLAALEMLDGKQRGPREEVAGEDFIAALLTDAKTPAVVLRRGLRLLRPDHPGLTQALIKRFLSSTDELLRLEAVRTLSTGSRPGRFEILQKIADDPHESVSLRAQAIMGLADGASQRKDRLMMLTKDGQPVIRQEAIRALRGVDLSGQERDRLNQAVQGDDESRALLASLQTYRAGDQGRAATRLDHGLPPLADLDAWLARLAGPADAEAGERVFFHPKGPGCYRCHEVNGRGGRSGPDLSTLAAGMDRRRLVQSILQPSLEVAPQFVAWSVARTDGTVFNGVLVSESPDGTLTFADADGRLKTVNSSDIEERKPQPTSIMPDNLAQSLTLQEFRDLTAFLLSSNKK
jgi:putative membrane-bound dehydrogenase-like protein